ncbi:MAG: hypothetical protein KGM24_01610 [Elusimicrobia bacterium]|nr:hypothetical protein [Elusimicrobiota bacterium]
MKSPLLAAALLASLAAAAAAAAGAVELSIPTGPAYSELEGQVAAFNRQDYEPRERTWRDRGLRVDELVDNTCEPGAPPRIVVIVRRDADKPRVAPAARRVLGGAASLLDPKLYNFVTPTEYLEVVVSSLKEMNRVSGHHYAVDYGGLRSRIRADLRGVRGALYVMRCVKNP